ncbi:MAG TPA: 16S rRNA (guanine(966)-N(2))-methyltransferase RsmD, partial [Tepidimicrobium sp.]|nr:16S rRNA (guanine(966)-N(2))-methyltransferase RsmD [Tepidimicrobium sp.]
MRVISGIRKGYKIRAPKGRDTRPTKDRIKESMFNILGNISEESIVLDLYAGSGSIGIEFLSRGARKAYFVDGSHWSIKAIKENLIHTKLRSNSEIIRSNSIKAIKLLGRKKIKFNYIFMDPPFGQDLTRDTLLKIIQPCLIQYI